MYTAYLNIHYHSAFKAKRSRRRSNKQLMPGTTRSQSNEKVRCRIFLCLCYSRGHTLPLCVNTRYRCVFVSGGVLSSITRCYCRQHFVLSLSVDSTCSHQNSCPTPRHTCRGSMSFSNPGTQVLLQMHGCPLSSAASGPASHALRAGAGNGCSSTATARMCNARRCAWKC